MQVTAKADYAARVLCQLAVAGEELTKADDLADAQQIPRSFLSVILAELGHAGLIVSQRGPAGGYRLARPADSITLADAVRAIDGPLALIHGQRPEDATYVEPAACLQDLWVALRASVRDVLEHTTIQQVVSGRLPKQVTDYTEHGRSWEPAALRLSAPGSSPAAGPPRGDQELPGAVS